MNIFTEFRQRVIKAVEALGVEVVNGGELDFGKLGIEPPRDPSHGDIATNAALVLAKQVGMAPRELGRTACRETVRGRRCGGSGHRRAGVSSI